MLGAIIFTLMLYGIRHFARPRLQEAGISDITIVVGYKAEMFEYLKEKFGVSIVLNEDYYRYNNTSSVIRVLDKLGNTYICSSDNYFPENVFKEEPTLSYYSALYAESGTNREAVPAAMMMALRLLSVIID